MGGPKSIHSVQSLYHQAIGGTQRKGKLEIHDLSKGGLISESFSLLLKSGKKWAKSLSRALSRTYREDAQDSNLTPFVWRFLFEKLSEI